MSESEPGRPPSSTASTSRSLLSRIKAQDRSAWDRLVSLYTPLVYGWCRSQGLQAHDVADVVQEVFQAVARSIGHFKKEKPGDTFRGWLRTITRNKIRDRYRKQEPEGAGGTEAQQAWSQIPAGLPQDDDLEPDAEAEQDLYLRGLTLIRDNFEPKTWRAFWRTAVDGQTPRDVGEELSMSPGAVRVAKSRVLHRLREELGDLMD